MALFTNRHRLDAEKFIVDIRKYFLFVVGGDDVQLLKPNPEGIRMILEKTGSRAHESIMIGDMPEDIMAGKSARTLTGVVKWGLGDWKELLAAGSDYAFEKPTDLLWI